MQEEKRGPPSRNTKAPQSGEREAGFGIDQTASFLSPGGVVLDDLLKLKQPVKGNTLLNFLINFHASLASPY